MHNARSTPGIFLLAMIIAGVTEPSAAAWNALGEIRSLGPGITPGIAVDPSGTIHVVYMDDGLIFHRSGGADGLFGPPEAVPVPEGRAAYNSPHLVCDRHGSLHLVFERDYTRESKKAWYTNRHEGAWKEPLLAIDRSGTERRVNYPRLAVDDSAVYVSAFTLGGSAMTKIANPLSTPVVAKTAETLLWAAHPLLQGAELLIVGRAGPNGHKLERYTRSLEPRGESQLLSRGTPTKTGEPTAAIIDENGIVHAAGTTGSPMNVLWYTTSDRAAAGKDVILGPHVGHDASEFTFPVLLRDERGRILVSYRDHATGESCLALVESDAERFARPVVVAPRLTRRLRWNAHLAAAPGGGAYIIWDMDGQLYFRAVGEASYFEPAAISVSTANARV